MAEAKLVLKKGRERSLKRHHPWIFSGAIQRVEGDPGPGDTVQVLDAWGNPLAKASYSPKSEIRARAWTFHEEERVDSELFKRRIKAALRLREGMPGLKKTNALRLIYSESDGLPGLIVDRYGEFLVCQFLSAGAERWKKEIVGHLVAMLSPLGIYERSDAPPRKKEGLGPEVGVLFGKVPPDLIEIQEDGARFLVDLKGGQKTGFYLDQRANRRLVALFSEGKEVLNCFSYTGGFSVFSMLGGARYVTDIEISGANIKILRENLRLNLGETYTGEIIKGDVFRVLRTFRDQARSFDLVILDPPKFAESRRSIPRATRGYKDINLLAMKLLRPGGLLFTFSCSGLIDQALFQKVVAGAALDSKREVKILKRLQQGPDHPVLVNFPEGSYLKGFILKVW